MKNLSFLLLVALVLSACSGIKVVSDMDPSVNFNDHKTLEYYGWVEESDQIMNRF
jgi:PBP1b-binding outer membrane lipoprotein LpoB